MADLLTLTELWGDVRGRTLAFIGDGNNVATSLVHAAMLSGLNMRIASPEGFDLPAHVVADAERIARHGATLTLVRDPKEAVRERRRGLHRRVDVDGSGSGDREPQSGVSAVSGERRPDGATRPATPSSCTVSRRTAATKSPTK